MPQASLYWPQFILTNALDTNLFQSLTIPIWHDNEFKEKEINDVHIANWLNENGHKTSRENIFRNSHAHSIAKNIRNYKNVNKEGTWVGYNEDGIVGKEYTGNFKNGEKLVIK